MPAARTIVFGDDGSPNADRAWLWINSHEWPGWRLEVVRAEVPDLALPPTPVAAKLHEWEPPARRPVGEGAQFAELVYLTGMIDPRLALARPSDLVVIGPRGRGVLKSLHLGSTAEWLLASPVAPIVVARAATAVHSVLVCHDGSEHASHMVEQMCAFPWVSGTEVCVLVVDDGRTNPRTAEAQARADFAVGGVTPEVVTRTGNPTPVIAEELDRRNPDLVTLGTRGLTGIARLRRGSTASAIARTAPCSVLVGADRRGGGEAPATDRV